MLVIVVQTSGISGDQLPWLGQRHDDDGPESTGTQTAQGLFDSVFHALHDGEQVSIGFDCPLAVADADADDSPGVQAMRGLVTEIGRWRPWTLVTTALPRWRATTSVLVWEASLSAGTEALQAITAFYASYATADDDGRRGADDAPGGLVNLAAVAALEAGVVADPAEATRPLLRITTRPTAAATS